MEAFTIQCSTCQSLIRVRNPKMIGQIANCPKCNSMIMIAPPQQQIRVESQGEVDSNAMTKEAFQPIDDDYGIGESTATRATSQFGDAHDGNDDASDGPLAAPPVSSGEPGAANEETWVPHTAAPLLPSEQWTSPDAARKRQILMIVLLGAGGVILSGLLFFAFLRWYSADRSDTTTVAQNQNGANQSGSNADASNNSANQVTAPNSDSPALDQPDTTEDDPNLDPSLEPEVMTPQPEPNPGDPSADQPAATENPPGDTTASAAAPIPTVGEAEPVKPSESDLTATEPAAAAAAELPKQLEKFAELLESPQISPQLPPEIAALEKPPLTADDLGLTQTSESKAVAVVDVSRQMQLELSGLILSQLSPSHAINTWVLLSGIPTYVDIDSLAAAGIDRNAKISVAFKGPETFKINEVATELAARMDVIFESVNNQFVFIRASSEAVDERLPTTMKITDLAGDAESQQWLLAALDQLFPNYTGKWRIGDGSLSVDPAEVDIATWMWIVRTLEAWRLEAGLESQLQKLDAKQFITKFVDVQKLDQFDKPLQLVTLQSTPAAQLISQVCAASNLQAWVDWPSVGQNGLGYNSSDMVITHQRTLRQILKFYAEKYALTIALDSHDALWITTPQSYRSQARLYVLPSAGKTAEQWQEELEPLTPIGVAGIDQVQAILTPDSRFVIVRCCRPRL